ncbi:hypothetical protein OC846_003667 [Tilletia horrida]|uniref:Glycosyltransferase family 31 protein n=1 Tax=Tilletia horrida TaxID=155126 RepID=A0AAN6JXR7_9BASI|nr:hypothetical protein OC846_003667 [Tilletia horrida]KAK0565540.1 hypothetical protein OC861_003702 [Tilletia horrida]
MSASFDQSWDFDGPSEAASGSAPHLKGARTRRRRPGGGAILTLQSALLASASIFIHPQRLARKTVQAVQSLIATAAPSSRFATSGGFLGSSSLPYKPLGGARHRSPSASSHRSHQTQHHHLPRRRNSISPSRRSYAYNSWTFSNARTRWLFLGFLLLAIAFITGITKLIIYILNPDKEPKTWQYFCTSQDDFPHKLADSLAPVDVFVGVFSIDSSYERRQLIRSTYATHTLPYDVHTGAQLSNVQIKFILGRPRKIHARRVALEMEAYNDIVVLDMEENMNQGKTYAYFRWASENATVPILLSQESSMETASPLKTVVGWKKADYVVKADDDAFIVLSELERHLRVSPRMGTYWGYLIRNWFMGGECYALSNDLVQYIASSPDVVRYTHGKEDKKVAQWMNLHPNASTLNWVSERCWIYDGPKAGTAYSHGYLFPDYVAKLKRQAIKDAAAFPESDTGGAAVVAGEESQAAGSTSGLLTEPRRSAEWRKKHSASTVSKWKQPYIAPRPGMSIEEEVEALVEGGGRWDGFWIRPAKVLGAGSPFDEEAYHDGLAPILTSGRSDLVADSAVLDGALKNGGGHHDYAALAEEFGSHQAVWVPFDSLVYEAKDPRLRPTKDELEAPFFRSELNSDPTSGLTLYNLSAASHQDLRDQSIRVRDAGKPPSRPCDVKGESVRNLEVPHATLGRRTVGEVVARMRTEDASHSPQPYLHSQHQGVIPSRYAPLTTGGRRPDPPSSYQVPGKHATDLNGHDGASGAGDPRQKYYETPSDILRKGNLTPEQRLRARRYLYRSHGGTVVVHYLKKSEWFFETAIALLGKDVLWPGPNAGAAGERGGRAREWRMWPSPRVALGSTEKEARIV